MCVNIDLLVHVEQDILAKSLLGQEYLKLTPAHKLHEHCNCHDEKTHSWIRYRAISLISILSKSSEGRVALKESYQGRRLLRDIDLCCSMLERNNLLITKNWSSFKDLLHKSKS